MTVNLNSAHISIWDAAHHWHNVPSAIENVPLPPQVRDRLTALLHAVVNSKLAVYEPVETKVEAGTGLGFRLRAIGVEMMDLDEAPKPIIDVYMSGAYDRAVLSYFRPSMDGLFCWVVRSGGEVPGFIPVADV